MNREKAKEIYDALWEDFAKADYDPEEWDLSEVGLDTWNDYPEVSWYAERLGVTVTEDEGTDLIFIWARMDKGSAYLSMDIRTEDTDHHFTDCT